MAQMAMLSTTVDHKSEWIICVIAIGGVINGIPTQVLAQANIWINI